MSGLTTGLYVPGNEGLRVGSAIGLNGLYGPSLAIELDWTPSLGNDLDDPTYPATYVWALEESSGATSLVESRVGGGTHDLDASGGSSNHLVGQTATGIYDGSDLSGRKCLEGTTSTLADRFLSSGGTLDSSAGSVAIRFRMRCPKPPTAIRHVMGTRGTDGWYVLIDTNGHAEGYVYDGSTAGGGSSSVNVCDGAWHEIEMIIDWTSDEVRMRIDGVAAGPWSLSSVTQANTGGDGFSIGGTNNQGSPLNCQIERVLGWEAGDGAESIDGTAWSDVSTYGAAPTGAPTATVSDDWNAAYSGTAPVPCDAGDLTGLWYLASGDKATDDFPIGYSSNLVTHGAPNGFGLYRNRAVTNLITRSEELENAAWSTVSNATVSASASDLIDNMLGFRMARKVTASADNGYIGFPVTVSNATNHRAWAYIAGNGGTVSGRIIAYDVSGAAETASTAFSVADGVLEPVGVNFVSASTSYEIRIEIDTNTEAINCCHVTLHQGSRSPYLFGFVHPPTFGATTTTPDTYDNGGRWTNFPWTTGTIDTYIVSHAQGPSGANNSLFRVDDIANHQNRLEFYHPSWEWQRVLHEDSDSTLVVNLYHDTPQTAANARAGYRGAYEWNALSPVSDTYYCRVLLVDDAGTQVTNGPTSGWADAGNTTGYLVLGHINAGTHKTNALVGYTRIWNGAGALEDFDV